MDDFYAARDNTMPSLPWPSIAPPFTPGDGPSLSNNLTGRDLLTPDEIMQLRPENQLLRVQGQATAVAQKLRYYVDPEFKGLFVPQDQ
ncbi:type IV secretory system conjugative DNA transfer family protein [Sulfitobacter sp. 1A09261]